MQAVERALAAGHLKQELVTDGPVAMELRDKAVRMMKEKAADALLGMIHPDSGKEQAKRSQATEARLQVAVELADMVDTAGERSTDVSSWFSDGTGKDHIKVLPGNV
jgi:hypothetical protein